MRRLLLATDEPDWTAIRPPRHLANSLASDPDDPVQALEEIHPFHGEELDVDAHTQLDLDEDQDLAEAESGAEAESMNNAAAYDGPTVDFAEPATPPRAQDTRDRPVADRGSGGPAGV